MPADNPPTRIIEISANLDDRTGEEVAAAIEALLAAGALDAWAQPIIMKKGRPGFVLSILCAAEDREDMAEALLNETGAFGCRYCVKDRLVLARSHVPVSTRFGKVRMKLGEHGGRIVACKPEYDDAKACAKTHGVPVRRVLEAARVAWAKTQDLPVTK